MRDQFGRFMLNTYHVVTVDLHLFKVPMEHTGHKRDSNERPEKSETTYEKVESHSAPYVELAETKSGQSMKNLQKRHPLSPTNQEANFLAFHL